LHIVALSLFPVVGCLVYTNKKERRNSIYVLPFCACLTQKTE